ncbi:MAG: PqqD family protein [Tidjanibacter sp.]|nr:PqqD family protein [Tidjanibacter sp.]
MRIKSEYKIRKIAGENVIVAVGATNVNTTSIISFNATSVELWNALSERDFTVADVVAIIKNDYGQSEEIATRDAAAWIEKLREAKLIEE